MEYLTVTQYAVKMQISTKTVYHLIKDGKIPAQRVGRQWRIPVTAAEKEKSE